MSARTDPNRNIRMAMSDHLQQDPTGDLKDRLDGLEFSLRFAQSLASVSPEREDLQERIGRLEAEIREVKEQLASQASSRP